MWKENYIILITKKYQSSYYVKFWGLSSCSSIFIVIWVITIVKPIVDNETFQPNQNLSKCKINSLRVALFCYLNIQYNEKSPDFISWTFKPLVFPDRNHYSFQKKKAMETNSGCSFVFINSKTIYRWGQLIFIQPIFANICLPSSFLFYHI